MNMTAPSSNRDHIIAIIKSIAGQTNILAIPRLFVDITGDLTLAAMLSQLIYWSDRTSRADGFVFKSAADWGIEVGASGYAVRKFKNLPFIETRIIKANGSPTTHYRVRFDELIDWIGRNQQIDLSNSSEPFDEIDRTLTEITTQTTHKITHKKGKSAPHSPKNTSTADDPAMQDLPTHSGSESLQDPPPDFHAFLSALAGVTKFDLTIKSNAARLGRASRQLIQAGYTTSDLTRFNTFWKEKDWRWKKDRQLPTPEDVISNIARSRSYWQPDHSSWLTTP